MYSHVLENCLLGTVIEAITEGKFQKESNKSKNELLYQMQLLFLRYLIVFPPFWTLSAEVPMDCSGLSAALPVILSLSAEEPHKNCFPPPRKADTVNSANLL